MNDAINQLYPHNYKEILQATEQSGFSMASDPLTCSLLRTLAASKPSGKFLELGTGSGLSTSWILEGMDKDSSLISIDNDPQFLNIAKSFLGNDSRVQFVLSDGEEWINANLVEQFDFIFADTWHGKYLLLEPVLDMLKAAAIYFIDDMLPQTNWPEGHAEKATSLVNYLDSRQDLWITKQNWASGILIATKR